MDQFVGPLSLKIGRLDELSDIISDLEHDEKGLPVLFQKYLQLGGRLLAFNLDPEFNKTLDGFVFLDLTQANRRLLEVYMGRDCASQYLSYHREAARLRRSVTGPQDWPRKSGGPEKQAQEWRPAASAI